MQGSKHQAGARASNDRPHEQLHNANNNYILALFTGLLCKHYLFVQHH